jgi:phospholipid/cholesterol/gamma-HCH transport system substrate-binding protein
VIKQAPSLGRIVAMVAFALSCFGILIFLWLSFGGPIPLNPEGYRVRVAFPEATTLAVEADVRMAGVNVGKVKTKELAPGGKRTLVELELKDRYGPIPSDTRAILRQKTLLGETYVELSPGERGAPMLEDGGRLPNPQVEPTVELDEIFGAFDRSTRQAFRDWVAELAKATRGGSEEDLNDAFGNLQGFAADGAELLSLLDEQRLAVRRFIRNTGRVFGAINERDGALRELIVNSNDTFEATASRDEALAETFRIFPTFLDESKATLARLERFAGDTRPLVNRLKAPADDLGPTLHDLGVLAPDLQRLFRDLDPLIAASGSGAPALRRFLEGAEPVLEGLDRFLDELNPTVSFLSYNQGHITNFLSIAAANLSGAPEGERIQTQIGVVDGRSFEKHYTRPDWERATAYPPPNHESRSYPLGILESFDCSPAGGEVRDPYDALGPTEAKEDRRPPCFVQPRSLYDGQMFSYPRRGVAPLRPPPRGRGGAEPAAP